MKASNPNNRFECPECWQAIEFPDSLSGQQINCPHCNQLVTLPEAVAENDSCATEVADDSWKIAQAHSHEPLVEKNEPTMEVAEQDAPPLKCEEIYYSDPKNDLYVTHSRLIHRKKSNYQSIYIRNITSTSIKKAINPVHFWRNIASSDSMPIKGWWKKLGGISFLFLLTQLFVVSLFEIEEEVVEGIPNDGLVALLEPIATLLLSFLFFLMKPHLFSMKIETSGKHTHIKHLDDKELEKISNALTYAIASLK